MKNRFKQRPQLVRSWYIGLFQIPILPEAFFKHFGDQLSRRLSRQGRQSHSSFSQVDVTGAIQHYRQAFRTLMTPNGAASSELVTAPVLALWGNRDPFLISPTEEEYRKQATRYTIRMLDGGHWIHSSRAETVNRHIRSFINGLDGANKGKNT